MAKRVEMRPLGLNWSLTLFCSVSQPPQVLRASGTLSERETMETEVIKLLISSYFSLSKRTLIDMVPKGECPQLDFGAHRLC